MIIGVTGELGAGKSTFAALLAEALRLRGRAVDLLNADAIVGDLYAQEEAALAAGAPAPGGLFARLAGRFGDDLFPGRRLDRKLLAGRAFVTAAAAAALNAIVHPFVIAECRRRIAAAAGDVIIDAPLLYESGLDADCAGVLVVAADAKARRGRKPQLTADDFAAREARQLPLEEKLRRGGQLVKNDDSREALARQAGEISAILLASGEKA